MSCLSKLMFPGGSALTAGCISFFVANSAAVSRAVYPRDAVDLRFGYYVSKSVRLRWDIRPTGILQRDHAPQWYFIAGSCVPMIFILLRNHVSQLYFIAGSCVPIVFYVRIMCINSIL